MQKRAEEFRLLATFLVAVALSEAPISTGVLWCECDKVSRCFANQLIRLSFSSTYLRIWAKSNVILVREDASEHVIVGWDLFSEALSLPSVCVLRRTSLSVCQGSRNFSDGWLAHWSSKGGGGDGVAVYALAALVCLVRNPKEVRHKAVAEVSKIGHNRRGEFLWYLVMHGWKSESTDGPNACWSCDFWSGCNGCSGHLTHNCWMYGVVQL